MFWVNLSPKTDHQVLICDLGRTSILAEVASFQIAKRKTEQAVSQ